MGLGGLFSLSCREIFSIMEEIPMADSKEMFARSIGSAHLFYSMIALDNSQ